MDITYLQGDATAPAIEGLKIIAHICNDFGAWDRELVPALSERWPHPEVEYLSWYWLKDGFELGNVDFVAVEPDILVANMIGQHGIDSTDDFPSLRYDAVDSCLAKVADKAKELDASIHWSRFGCGRWELIEPLLRKNLVERGVAVYVYDGNERSKPND